VAVGLSAGSAAAVPERPLDMLEFHANVSATPEETWQVWSTVEGLQSFFGPEVIFEPSPMGNFAIHWAPDNDPGSKGAEDLHILAFEPDHMRLAFTWSAPPQWPDTRKQRAMAEIRISATEDGTALVSLYHYGWGQGEEWIEVRDYFAEAWKIIFARMQYRFEAGPFDWENPKRDLIFTPAEFTTQ
jgi:uncharacterized protein YndB with AHSA1/START domain